MALDPSGGRESKIVMTIRAGEVPGCCHHRARPDQLAYGCVLSLARLELNPNALSLHKVA